MAHTRTDAEQEWQPFHELVNMTSRQLRDWLAASPAVFSQTAPGVAREEPEGDPTELGWRVAEMRQVVELIEDRLANQPTDTADSEEWRRGLMLLGHDPMAPSPPDEAVPH